VIGLGPPWIAHGKWILFSPTMKPTNAAIATRPCLISACRNQAIVERLLSGSVEMLMSSKPGSPMPSLVRVGAER